MGVGVDIVKVERFKKLSPRFITRVYTPREQEYLDQKLAQLPQSAAGLFAAKEAVAKAIGTGFTPGLQPTDIEILHDTTGKPYVILHNNTNAPANIELSIAHTTTDAIAFAVV